MAAPVPCELIPLPKVYYTQTRILHSCTEADFTPQVLVGSIWKHCGHNWGRTGGGSDMGLQWVEPWDAQDITSRTGQLLQQQILRPKMLILFKLEDPAA